MVAMVSATTLLPGKPLAVVPGDRDLPRRTAAGSRPNWRVLGTRTGSRQLGF